MRTKASLLGLGGMEISLILRACSCEGVIAFVSLGKGKSRHTIGTRPVKRDAIQGAERIDFYDAAHDAANCYLLADFWFHIVGWVGLLGKGGSESCILNPAAISRTIRMDSMDAMAGCANKARSLALGINLDPLSGLQPQLPIVQCNEERVG